MVPPDRQRAGLAASRTGGSGASSSARAPFAGRPPRPRPAYRRRSPAAPVTPTFAASLPPPSRRPGHPAAGGDGHRQLAASALDAAGASTSASTGRFPTRSSRPPPTTPCASRSRPSGAPASTSLTDGEQRRDNYASFVGARLDNCQLIPLTDLLPYVDHPEEFRAQLDQLDVPAERGAPPGRLRSARPFAAARGARARLSCAGPGAGRRRSRSPCPGPYLLARTMWMECISDRAYASREALADDLVRVLREEIALPPRRRRGAGPARRAGADRGRPTVTRAAAAGRFMCGALGESGEPRRRARVRGGPAAVGSPRACPASAWRSTSAAATGRPTRRAALARRLGAAPRLPRRRAGRHAAPRDGHAARRRRGRARRPARDKRIGVGVVNQKLERVETVDEILARVEPRDRAVRRRPACSSSPTAASPPSATTRSRPPRSPRPSSARSPRRPPCFAMKGARHGSRRPRRPSLTAALSRASSRGATAGVHLHRGPRARKKVRAWLTMPQEDREPDGEEPQDRFAVPVSHREGLGRQHASSTSRSRIPPEGVRGRARRSA